MEELLNKTITPMQYKEIAYQIKEDLELEDIVIEYYESSLDTEYKSYGYTDVQKATVYINNAIKLTHLHVHILLHECYHNRQYRTNRSILKDVPTTKDIESGKYSYEDYLNHPAELEAEAYAQTAIQFYL